MRARYSQTRTSFSDLCRLRSFSASESLDESEELSRLRSFLCFLCFSFFSFLLPPIVYANRKASN